MIKELPTFSRMIQGVETTLRPYAFQWKNKKVKLIPGKVHTVSKKRSLKKHIYNSFVALVGGTPLLRTASFETEDKAEAFLALVQSARAKKKQPLRLGVSYIASPEQEWDLVETENRRLIALAQKLPEGDQIVQISVGTEPLFTNRPKVSRVKNEQEALEKIPRYMNMDGWVSYSAWYNELLEEAFAQFLHDATDAYTLERYLKDFKHEVFSPYLRWTRQRLAELELAELHKVEEGVSRRNRIEMTKRRISHQRDLRRMVEVHYGHLLEIIKLITLIETAHPELKPLREIGQVLEKLLADQLGFRVIGWGKTHMLLQLLDVELGVLSAISGAQGLGRTHLAFAIRLAVLQMKETLSRQDLLDLVLNWEEADPTHPHVARFRECVLANLLEFCAPIASLNAGETPPRWYEGLRENPDALSFLPPYDVKGAALVLYDPQTSAPQELTSVGRRLLFPLLGSAKKFA